MLRVSTCILILNGIMLYWLQDRLDAFISDFQLDDIVIKHSGNGRYCGNYAIGDTSLPRLLIHISKNIPSDAPLFGLANCFVLALDRDITLHIHNKEGHKRYFQMDEIIHASKGTFLDFLSSSSPAEIASKFKECTQEEEKYTRALQIMVFRLKSSIKPSDQGSASIREFYFIRLYTVCCAAQTPHLATPCARFWSMQLLPSDPG